MHADGRAQRQPPSLCSVHGTGNRGDSHRGFPGILASLRQRRARHTLLYCSLCECMAAERLRCRTESSLHRSPTAEAMGKLQMIEMKWSDQVSSEAFQ